MNITIQSEN